MYFCTFTEVLARATFPPFLGWRGELQGRLTTWLKLINLLRSFRCYQLLDRRLRKSLKNVYMVHPTFWLKSLVWMSRPFISSKFWRKLVYVKSLEELYSLVPSVVSFGGYCWPSDLFWPKMDSLLGTPSGAWKGQGLRFSALKETLVVACNWCFSSRQDLFSESALHRDLL